MYSKLFNSVGKIAFACTALSFSITTTMILSFSDGPNNLETAEVMGLLLSVVLPLLFSVPMSHYFFSQNQKLEKLTQQLQMSQRIDSLTRLLTRTAFYHDVETILEAPGNRLKEHALFFIDLDNFKKINDTHGHQTGDNALRVFGEVMFDTISGADIAGRLGGEEFCLFSPDCNEEEATAKAQELINRFQQRACVVGGKHIKGTISVGICMSNRTDGLDTLMSIADSRMYKAKANGKNQFFLHETGQCPSELAA